MRAPLHERMAVAADMVTALLDDANPPSAGRLRNDLATLAAALERWRSEVAALPAPPGAPVRFEIAAPIGHVAEYESGNGTITEVLRAPGGWLVRLIIPSAEGDAIAACQSFVPLPSDSGCG